MAQDVSECQGVVRERLNVREHGSSWKNEVQDRLFPSAGTAAGFWGRFSKQRQRQVTGAASGAPVSVCEAAMVTSGSFNTGE